MDSYELDISSRAERNLKSLKKRHTQQYGAIVDAISGLLEDPQSARRKLIKGCPGLRDHWRIRVGIHYRIGYRVDDDERVVELLYVTTAENAPYR